MDDLLTKLVILLIVVIAVLAFCAPMSKDAWQIIRRSPAGE